MGYVTKSPKKGAKPSFPAKSSPGVKIAKDGGHNLGTPTHCESDRAADNLKGVYA